MKKTLFSKFILIGLLTFLLASCNPDINHGEANKSQSQTPRPSDPNRYPEVLLELDGLAAGYSSEQITGFLTGENVPEWMILPAHTRITLDEYVIKDHFHQPQVIIYPVEKLYEINPTAAENVDELIRILESHQDLPDLPFLPILNAAQVFHTHVQYLNFYNGQGMRYLTQFSQGLTPVNNYDLLYTFQGLTNDGMFYVAVILPVIHPELPPAGTISGEEPASFTEDYQAYIDSVVELLNTLAEDTFQPTLFKLDALIQTLEVKR